MAHSVDSSKRMQPDHVSVSVSVSAGHPQPDPLPAREGEKDFEASGYGARRKVREWQFSVALAGLVLGVLLALQIRTQWNLRRMSSPTAGVLVRSQSLAQRLLQVSEENQRLRKEVESLRAQLAEYEQLALKGKSALRAIHLDLQRTKILAGISRVKGAGIIVKLNDARKVPTGQYPELSIVHDVDLLHIVNELKAAKAEAIAVNNQRVIATTAIRCSGNIIEVNGVPIAPPYEIVAIGDPQVLEKGLTLPQGIVDQLKLMGIPVKIQRREEVIVPALPAMPISKYARPADLLPPFSQGGLD